MEYDLRGCSVFSLFSFPDICFHLNIFIQFPHLQFSISEEIKRSIRKQGKENKVLNNKSVQIANAKIYKKNNVNEHIISYLAVHTPK
jgi:hypothetical protein